MLYILVQQFYSDFGTTVNLGRGETGRVLRSAIGTISSSRETCRWACETSNLSPSQRRLPDQVKSPKVPTITAACSGLPFWSQSPSEREVGLWRHAPSNPIPCVSIESLTWGFSSLHQCLASIDLRNSTEQVGALLEVRRPPTCLDPAQDTAVVI